MVDEKGLSEIEKYGGDIKGYDDFKFEMGLFLGRKQYMPELLSWLAKLLEEPKSLRPFMDTMDGVTADIAEDLNRELYEVLVARGQRGM